MNRAHSQYGPQEPTSSSENFREDSPLAEQHNLHFEREQLLPGSYDDASVIRAVLSQGIKRSGMSCAAVADQMTFLLGRTVTEKMLYAFTADRDDRRWPAEFDRAFCKATGDNTLLRCRAERAGFQVLNLNDVDLLELGRAHFQRAQADGKIAFLQQRIAGRSA